MYQEAIDRLEVQLEAARELPSWAIALITSASLCLGGVLLWCVALCLLAPCVRGRSLRPRRAAAVGRRRARARRPPRRPRRRRAPARARARCNSTTWTTETQRAVRAAVRARSVISRSVAAHRGRARKPRCPTRRSGARARGAAGKLSPRARRVAALRRQRRGCARARRGHRAHAGADVVHAALPMFTITSNATVPGDPARYLGNGVNVTRFKPVLEECCPLAARDHRRLLCALLCLPPLLRARAALRPTPSPGAPTRATRPSRRRKRLPPRSGDDAEEGADARP